MKSAYTVQVILSVAPAEILEQIEHKFFRNHLAYLAMHPVANFVVQALLGSITKSPQVGAPEIFFPACPLVPPSIKMLVPPLHRDAEWISQ